MSGEPAWDTASCRNWSELRDAFAAHVAGTFDQWITPDQPHYHDQMQFAVGRFDEGLGILRYLAATGRIADGWRILDIGAGNGGVSLALANDRRTRVFAMDIVPNGELFALRRAFAIPIEQIVASGHHIPFADQSFDIVLLLDTLEHVPAARLLGPEVMRVLRPGGVCMITTPARLRHLFGRDPHYDVPGLLFFPNEVQRFIVNRIFRRRIGFREGHIAGAYDVEHIFWHVNEIARLFPSPKRVDVLYNRTFGPIAPREWIRRPAGALEWIRFRARLFFWDRILISKPAGSVARAIAASG